MPQLELYLLDHPRVELDGRALRFGRRSALALLIYLACEPRAHSRDRLATLFWPDYGQGSARHNLNNSLSALRKAAGREWFHSTRASVHLPPHPDLRIDVQEFNRLVTDRCHHNISTDNSSTERLCQKCLRELEEATALYGDGFLAGFSMPDAADFEEWQRGQTETLRTQMQRALERLGRAYADLGQIPLAQTTIRRLINMDPVNERAHRLLVRIYLKSDERAAAVATMEACIQLLAAEGLHPSEATVRLAESMVQRPEPPNEWRSADTMAHPPAAGVNGSGTVASLPAPPPFVTTDYRLIGRGREWRQLRARWQGLDQPHFVCIAGEAGIGKTRLAEELLMDAQREGQRVARTRSHALEGRLAYGPVADWLRADPLRAALTRLEPVWLAEVARIVPELLIDRPELPHPAPITDSWQRKRLFEALLHAFTQNPAPLLLVLDDLQWCDSDTLEWLQYLLERCQNPLLVVGSVRITEIDDAHPLHRLRQQLQRLDRWSHISLSPLTPEATTALAEHVSERTANTASMEAGRASTIFADTAGNPLFVIESVRATPNHADADGTAAGDATHAGDPSADIPPKMVSVIQTRLARLSPAAHELVQLAATIGRAFDVELLGRAAAISPEAVLTILDELWQQRMIREVDGLHFDFSHDRIRDVAYAEIRPVRRRLLHRQVAGALQEIHDAAGVDRVSGQIATHYEMAGEFRDAIAHYLRAKKIADGVHAYKEKIRYLSKSTGLMRQLPDRTTLTEEELSLLEEQREAYIAVEGYSSIGAERACRQMLELADGTGSELARWYGLAGLRNVHQDRGEFQQALTYAREAFAVAQIIDDPIKYGRGLQQQAATYFHMGRLHKAWPYFVKAIELQHPLAPLRTVHTAWLLGYAEQARELSDQSIRYMRDRGDPNHLCNAIEFAGQLDFLQRDFNAMRTRYPEADGLATKYELPFYQASNYYFLGCLLVEDGDADGAMEAFQRGVQVSAHVQAKQFLALWHCIIVDSLLRGQKLTDALTWVDRAIATANQMGEAFLTAEFFRLKGDILLRLYRSGDMDTVAGTDAETESLYQDAIHLAQRQGAKMLELRATVSLCRLWQERGQIQEAHQILSTIYAWFTEGLDTVDLLEAKTLLDELEIHPLSVS